MLDPSVILERSQWDFFWIPEDTVAHERQGLAYLASPHDLPHLNAVTRTDLSDGELEAAVSEVVDAHRNVRSRWHVYSRIEREPLQKALARGGYLATTDFDARAIQVDAHRPRATADFRIVRVTDMQTLQQFHDVNLAAFGLRRSYTREQLEAQLRQCEAPDARIQRFIAYQGERAVSCGGLNALDALGFGLLWAGGTVPDARGRGAYSALVNARIVWARNRGLSLVGLYAVSDTSSPITAKQGFAKHGALTYWERAPQHS
jgi:GNAT superfamily N-acetyltransferase